MPQSDNSRVEQLLAAMRLDEKALLTAGEDLWSLPAIERVGIPKVRVTDGPSGARGPQLPGQGGGWTSVCVPCGSALGATWDVELVERVGALLGREARRKTCHVLLAPTVNLHRSPLAGRNFECYSEDPRLSGALAAAFIRGAQGEGVATTVKHFVCNDAETERYTMSSVVDERTLRELYLVPFEHAVRDGGSLGIMTAYNRLNGEWCSERGDLLAIARDEWGFEGFVLTDWYGVASTTRSAEAGVDLEMPGPPRAFGPAIATAVERGELDEARLDAQVSHLLSVLDRVGALDATGEEPRSEDLPEERELVREASAASIVLLENRGVLPVDSATTGRVLVVGPNADRPSFNGGGSAQVEQAYTITPLQALRASFGPATEVRFEPGTRIDRTVPTLEVPTEVEYHAGAGLGGEALLVTSLRAFEVVSLGPPPGVEKPFSFRAVGVLEPEVTGRYELTLVQSGRARLLVDGEVLLDGFESPPPRSSAYLGYGSEEMRAFVELEAHAKVEIAIEYSSSGARGVNVVKVGCREVLAEDALDRAAAAAAEADVVIAVVGTTREWESEGFDRVSMTLPGAQDELVRRVAAANPRTVVALNTGAPVAMPWADDVGAIVQLWFGGQEMSGALADIMTGDAEPGGRLPTSIPFRLEDNPSFGNFPGESSEVRYGEGLFVGYRWYDTRGIAPRYPFGHGLAYTTFSIGEPACPVSVFRSGDRLAVTVPVANTGSRGGSQVVQLYVAPLDAPVVRPEQELVAFAKVHLEPGEVRDVVLELDDRAFAYWDVGTAETIALRARVPDTGRPRPEAEERSPGWVVAPGSYELRVGSSSAAIAHRLRVVVPDAGSPDA
jgi:beta-glucosidase